MMLRNIRTGLLLGSVALLLAACENPVNMESEQKDYRGVGAGQVTNTAIMSDRKKAAYNAVPEAQEPAEPSDEKAKDVYQNVPVLGNLSVEEFNRIMVAITAWVSPEQGCGYCHNVENMASDNVYTKIVARRMFQKTAHINNNWKAHVENTGVTCYTCHRGQPVPANIWFEGPKEDALTNFMGKERAQDRPEETVAYSSLPNEPFTNLINENSSNKVGRVQGNTALPIRGKQGRSIRATEYTYGLMMHFSNSLGVNCTYCHNSRAFGNWQQSYPTRTKAWHALQMLRDLNNEYLKPLQSTYPEVRLSKAGGAPQANCATCHYGAPKPLYGAQMMKDYLELNKADIKAPYQIDKWIPKEGLSKKVPVPEADASKILKPATKHAGMLGKKTANLVAKE